MADAAAYAASALLAVGLVVATVCASALLLSALGHWLRRWL